MCEFFDIVGHRVLDSIKSLVSFQAWLEFSLHVFVSYPVFTMKASTHVTVEISARIASNAS